jgi:hypothetical protein
MMLSISLQTPELILTEDESKMLASAFAAVAKQHPDVIDPKKATYVQLAVAIGVVYGSRVIAIRGRKSRDTVYDGSGPRDAFGNVVNFSGT